MSDRIEKTIDLKAPLDRVWEAITDPAQFGEWFRVKLETPFVPGQEAHGPILHPGYEHIIWRAVVVSLEPKRLFSFNWRPYAIDPNVDYSGEEPTLVEFILEPKGEGTRLVIRETGFDKVPEHRRAEAFRMNDSGWTQQIQNIKSYVGG